MLVMDTGVMVANPEDIDLDEGDDDDEEMAEPADAVEEKAVPVSCLMNVITLQSSLSQENSAKQIADRSDTEIQWLLILDIPQLLLLLRGTVNIILLTPCAFT